MENIIYQIKNIKNQKRYVGSTINKERRWKEHKKALRHNRHVNQHLQNAWNKYGADKFKFSVVEKLKEDDNLEGREQFYLDNKNCEYNIASDAKAPMRGKKHTQKAKQKISKVHKGKEISEETREKMSKALSGEKNPNYGENRSQITKKKISKSRKGKLTGKNNPMYSKERSEKVKKAISRANSGREHASGEDSHAAKLTKKKVKIIKYLLKGGHFMQRQIASIFSVSQATISYINCGKVYSDIII